MALRGLIITGAMLALGSGFSLYFVDSCQMRKLLMTIHRPAGLAVLILIFGRFLVGRFSESVRTNSRDWAGWADWAAQGALVALYAELFILPLLGWALTNAQGRDVFLVGIRLPRLIQEASPDFAYTLEDFHSAAAWILLPLIALRLVWMLWLHFNRREDDRDSTRTVDSRTS